MQIEMLKGPGLPGTEQSGLDFIHKEQNALATAQFLDALA